MAEDIWARQRFKAASGLPTVPVSASHNNGDWIDTDIYEEELYMDLDTGKVYTRIGSSIIDTGSVGSVNIFNSDGTLNGDRVLDADGNNMQFINLANLLIQSTENIGIRADKSIGFQVIDVPTSLPSISMTLKGSLDSEILVLISDGILNDMIRIYGSGKTSIKNAVKIGDESVQSNDSVLFEVASTTQGSIPFPRMTDAQRLAIISPAIGLMVYVTDATEGIYVKKSTGWTFVA